MSIFQNSLDKPPNLSSTLAMHWECLLYSIMHVNNNLQLSWLFEEQQKKHLVASIEAIYIHQRKTYCKWHTTVRSYY